jgi:hypothetical protein
MATSFAKKSDESKRGMAGKYHPGRNAVCPISLHAANLSKKFSP